MHNRMLRPVERPLALGEQVYHALRAQLRSGAIASGQALQEVQLAEQLGVSRTPVREAMARMASEGLLPGDTSETITVAVQGDLLDEINEQYFLNLSGPVNGRSTTRRARARLQTMTARRACRSTT